MTVLQDWEIALFDAGGTLIRQHPGLSETILAFSETRACALTMEQAERAALAARAWADGQSLRELRGAPRLGHDAFLTAFYGTALGAALSDRTPAEIAALGAEAYAFAGRTQHWAAVEGARETLEHLRTHGRRAGLVSNFSTVLRAILRAEGLLELLDPVVVSAEVGVEKPDPLIMRIACDLARVEPERAVYVGDHPLDIVCCRRAGMRIIWVPHQDRLLPPELAVQPDLSAASITEVPALLGLR